MKIAYLSRPFNADVDLCYLDEARKRMDITYYLILTPASCKATAINIQKMHPKSGIFPLSIYPELASFGKFVDADRFYIVNLPAKHAWHIQTLLTFLKLFIIFWRKFDIVHTTTYFSYNFLFFFLLSKKMLLTMHDPFSHSNVRNKMTLFDRKNALNYFRNFLLLNKAQFDDFKSFYHMEEQGKHVYLSSLSTYNYLRCFDTSHCPATGEYIVFWGRICSYKGLEYLFPAMEKVHSALPDLKLVVAGGGDYYFDISRYQTLDYFDIRNRFIPDDELASLIRHSLFAVVPYNDATQSGVIMSAYAFYKPCIATDVGGLPEMVLHGKNGLIVPPRDVDALADAITHLASNRKQIERFSAEIKKDYESGDKSWSHITEEMETIYIDVFNHSK